MKLIILLVILFFNFSTFVFAQNMQTYSRNWQTEIKGENPFQLQIQLQKNEKKEYSISLKNDTFLLSKEVIYDSKNQFINCQIAENLSFNGYFTEDKSSLRGFITSGILNYQVCLEKNKLEIYEGKWNILMIDTLLSQNIYLSIENAEEDSYEAYPIFGDNRFTGTWCANFQKKDDKIIFQDMKTGLAFEGILMEKQINLSILLAGKVLFKTIFIPSNEEWKIGNFDRNDKNESKDKNHYSNSLDLSILEDSIKNNVFPNTHSILISKNGNLIYQNYFQGYNQNLVHDQRSASKSVSSAITGIMIDKKIISSSENLLIDFTVPYYFFKCKIVLFFLSKLQFF